MVVSDRMTKSIDQSYHRSRLLEKAMSSLEPYANNAKHELKNSSPLNTGSSNGDRGSTSSCSDILTENFEPTKVDLDIGETSATFVSRKSKQEASTGVVEEESFEIAKGKGTTNIACIHGKLIFLGVDSRATNIHSIGFINDDRARKVFEIKHNIVATMAGNSQSCENMLRDVQQQNVIDKDINRAAELAKSYITDEWEPDNEGQQFPASSYIAGFERNENPHIYQVSCAETVQASYDHAIGIMGSGKHFTEEYIKNYQWKGNGIKEEILKAIKEAFLAGALNDPMTGGSIRLYEVRPYGYSKLYSEEVLQVLLESYDAFSEFLSKTMFTVWYYDYHQYDYSHNEGLKGYFQSNNFDIYHVIAVKRTCTIRILNYKSKDRTDYVHEKLSHEYDNLKASYGNFDDLPHRKLSIPPQIRDLPWTLLNDFRVNNYPVAFIKPTREMVELLRDV